MTSWLSRQRKGDLQQLASTAGITDADSMLKDDLVTNLDSVLRSKSSEFSSNPAFKEFYERGRNLSPTKKQRAASTTPASPDAESSGVASKPAAPKQRRKTIKKEDIVDAVVEAPSAAAQAIAQRTPVAVQRLASRVPLPPSPAVVTDAISRQQEVFADRLDTLWQDLGITEYSDWLRASLSSVTMIQVICTLLEAYGLQKQILPWDMAADVPSIPAIKFESRTIHLPNFFALLGGEFWSTSAVWLTTSVLVPLIFAYFFNLTLASRPAHVTRQNSKSNPRHDVDPLTFNVAKALITWLVYSQGYRFFGAFADTTVARINGAFLGGYWGVMVGSGIGALTTVYDAILRK